MTDTPEILEQYKLPKAVWEFIQEHYPEVEERSLTTRVVHGLLYNEESPISRLRNAASQMFAFTSNTNIVLKETLQAIGNTIEIEYR